jgi:hypothetical protein
MPSSEILALTLPASADDSGGERRGALEPAELVAVTATPSVDPLSSSPTTNVGPVASFNVERPSLSMSPASLPLTTCW